MTRRYYKQINQVSFIRRQAPVLDSMLGLLEPPYYVQFLGDRNKAEHKIKFYYPECHKIIRERDFNDYNRLTDGKRPYTKKLSIIDIDDDYKLKFRR